MKIGFVHSQKSYLPEINAYSSYFNVQEGLEAQIINYKQLKEIQTDDFDLIWKFPGIDIKRVSNTKIIHEYNSLSTGYFPVIKNYLKQKYNIKPDGRVFLNEVVERELAIKDGVPKIIRDMGIAKQFFIHNTKKEYDFVYVGTMGKARGLAFGLQPFTKELKSKSILLIGEPENYLYKEYKNFKNIIFTGSIPYNEVPLLASKAIYGFNYVPDFYPFNVQTSTKLLEYCAMGLNIVTTDYRWVNTFEKDTSSIFFKLNSKLENLTTENIEKFNFITPKVNDFEWNNIFEKIKILDFLKAIMK